MYIWICIYLFICKIFAFSLFCFVFLSFFSLPITAWGRLNKTQMMANYQELRSVFVWIWLIFISVCKTFAFPLMYVHEHFSVTQFVLKKKKKRITILSLKRQMMCPIEVLSVCLCDFFHYILYFLLLLFLFVLHFWLATHLSQIHLPSLRILKSNWLMINLQGVCFVTLMHKSHKGFC